jgi:hypothetical protein
MGDSLTVQEQQVPGNLLFYQHWAALYHGSVVHKGPILKIVSSESSPIVPQYHPPDKHPLHVGPSWERVVK